jgi:cytidine deaminase
VAATLLTDQGTLYSGVCLDTGSGTGFCAEHAAIAAMVTAGEYRIAKIVAVWRDEDISQLHLLPPCGRCREFIRQIDAANLETEVVLRELRCDRSRTSCRSTPGQSRWSRRRHGPVQVRGQSVEKGIAADR